MTTHRALFATMFALAALALAGCTPDQPSPAPQERDKALQRVIEQPLDKARAVEDETLKAQQEQLKKIDEQGG